ncbi:MAG: hypothetical protein QOD26_3374 [Betaproteobacteria bacterium]|jgi:DNA-binding transcriptional regulator YdaS (Cro superfamily)|nr:hypothetical protein [Betaproteobacteria bacterium]
MAIAGGEARFAARLKVPVPVVVNWLAGSETIPDDIFLLAIDIVLSATPKEIRQSREILDRVKSSKH